MDPLFEYGFVNTCRGSLKGLYILHHYHVYGLIHRNNHLCKRNVVFHGPLRCPLHFGRVKWKTCGNSTHLIYSTKKSPHFRSATKFAKNNHVNNHFLEFWSISLGFQTPNVRRYDWTPKHTIQTPFTSGMTGRHGYSSFNGMFDKLEVLISTIFWGDSMPSREIGYIFCIEVVASWLLPALCLAINSQLRQKNKNMLYVDTHKIACYLLGCCIRK